MTRMRKRDRNSLHAHAGHKPRSKAETKAFLAMVRAQGEEAIERGQRIAAAYAADEVRQDEEATHARRYRRPGWRVGGFFPGKRIKDYYPHPESVAPPLSIPGATLAEKIAEKTRAFYALQERRPVEHPGPYTKRSGRPWWAFWRPRWVKYMIEDDGW